VIKKDKIRESARRRQAQGRQKETALGKNFSVQKEDVKKSIGSSSNREFKFQKGIDASWGEGSIWTRRGRAGMCWDGKNSLTHRRGLGANGRIDGHVSTTCRGSWRVEKRVNGSDTATGGKRGFPVVAVQEGHRKEEEKKVKKGQQWLAGRKIPSEGKKNKPLVSTKGGSSLSRAGRREREETSEQWIAGITHF